MSATPFIVLSAILFTIGAVGVLTRRNAIVVFMCVELMLNASNLALVTFSRVNGNLDGPDRGVLRDGRRRGRGRRRARDHHDHLPHPSLGLGRRRQPPQVLGDRLDLICHERARRRGRAPRPRRRPRAAAGSLALPLVLVIALPASRRRGAADRRAAYRPVRPPARLCHRDRLVHLLADPLLRDPGPRAPDDRQISYDLWTWFSSGDWKVQLGSALRPAVRAVPAADHGSRWADPHLLDRLHGARRAPASILRLPQPVRGGDADCWSSPPTTSVCSSAGRASAWRRTC